MCAYWKLLSWDQEKTLSIFEALALVMLDSCVSVSGTHFQRALGELKIRSWGGQDLVRGWPFLVYGWPVVIFLGRGP